MNRPYIICHMVMSIDGNVTGDFLRSQPDEIDELYFDLHRQFKAEAFACGKVTMMGSFTQGYEPDLAPFKDVPVERTDFIASQSGCYAVAFDRKGSLGWRDGMIYDEDPGYDQRHIIEVVTYQASDAYLAYLESIGVSYIICGDDDLDLPLALYKLKTLFGIDTLLLEGGSVINGAFEREGVIDELSLVQSPTIGGAKCGLLFHQAALQSYELISSEIINGVVYFRYRYKN
ncbi:MAG: dihydrofolate reductase family protein [Erysipelotrichaceae bacterium]|nr:dihydrofolate reductase family protein [Erysipelotrichaceae bacterium]